MDAAAVDPAALRRALGFIRRVNRLLRYNAATLRALQELIGRMGEGQTGRGGDRNVALPEQQAIRSHTPPLPHPPTSLSPSPPLPHSPSSLSLLDIATGSADLPQEIGRWASRRGLSIRCVGLDLHPATLAVARDWAPEVPLVRGDALRLPFDNASFDFATCGMFLHHLPTESAVQVIREMERVTRRGWIVADLLRRRRALAWISFFTLFAGRLERHDARVSVKQAFSPAEARQLAIDASAGTQYREVFGHRFLLMRDKGRIWPQIGQMGTDLHGFRVKPQMSTVKSPGSKPTRALSRALAWVYRGTMILAAGGCGLVLGRVCAQVVFSGFMILVPVLLIPAVLLAGLSRQDLIVRMSALVVGGTAPILSLSRSTGNELLRDAVIFLCIYGTGPMILVSSRFAGEWYFQRRESRRRQPQGFSVITKKSGNRRGSQSS